MNIHRISKLSTQQNHSKGEYVLYWMQQSQRVSFNHALEYAIQIANQKRLPLVVLFCLIDTYPEANLRHFHFMLEGLKETQKELENRGVNFVLRLGDPMLIIQSFIPKIDSLILDVGYLKHQKKWRDMLREHTKDILDVFMVESDVIVPVQMAYPKAAYGAYVIRSSLFRMLPFYRDFVSLSVLENQTKLSIHSDDSFDDLFQLMKRLSLDTSILPSIYFKAGYQAAINQLNAFINQGLLIYDQSNDPSLEATSRLSLYLHFGQISSLEIYEKILYAKHQQGISDVVFDAFIEQLFIRRELAINFVYYTPFYDDFKHMTEPWAYKTMHEHQKDARPYLYTKEDYIHFRTHDIYFNAAMKQMVKTGYMHNYMRMYWAKKIIEWSLDYQSAYQTILSLNNAYFIDGRDPNSYAGVAWCFGKHDRPWTDRPIFGSLRYMNAEGLKRKFNIDLYVQAMNLLV